MGNFDIVFALVIGVGLFLIARFGPRFFRRGPPRDQAQFQHELKRRAERYYEAKLYAAQCEVELVELTGEIPPHLDRHVFLACDVGEAMRRAIIREAEEQGITSPGLHAEVFEPPAPSARQASLRLATPVADPLPRVQFVGGRMQPR